jgi:hypothetical protein
MTQRTPSPETRRAPTRRTCPPPVDRVNPEARSPAAAFSPGPLVVVRTANQRLIAEQSSTISPAVIPQVRKPRECPGDFLLPAPIPLGGNCCELSSIVPTRRLAPISRWRRSAIPQRLRVSWRLGAWSRPRHRLDCRANRSVAGVVSPTRGPHFWRTLDSRQGKIEGRSSPNSCRMGDAGCETPTFRRRGVAVHLPSGAVLRAV